MIRFIRSRLRAALCIAVFFAVGTVWAGTLQGIATYRERMMLPPDALFDGQLLDISRADAPAAVLGRARLDPRGEPPFRFEIAYDDDAVKPESRYAVRATGTHRGQLLFTTDRVYPVRDGRSAPLELVLVSARREPSAATRGGGLGTLTASFEGDLPGANSSTRWHLDRLPLARVIGTSKCAWRWRFTKSSSFDLSPGRGSLRIHQLKRQRQSKSSASRS